MLDWQEKRWVKVIAVTVVFAFLTYDIAWATDFSPITIAPISVPNFSTLSKFIPGTNLIKKTLKTEEPEETEISFRSQLVPRKKYEERSGFQRMESVKKMIKRQIDELRKRQDIETERRQSIYNQYQINRQQYIQDAETGAAVQGIEQQLMKARGETMSAAARSGEFSYVLTKDGMRINYTDGLPSSMENERIVDSFGNVSYKNTKNMKYNNNRLMVSYDAEIVDALGNVTRVQWRNGTYSPDSSSIGNRYLIGYTETTTDAYGSTSIREWSTTRDAYDDKGRATQHHEVTKDALGNIISTSDWSSPSYEGDNMTGYHQETKDSYGNLYITDWSATFNEMGRITSVTTEDEQINRDLSSSKNKTVTGYEYDEDGNLVSALGDTTIEGEDGFANFYSGTTTHNYEVINGQIKLVNTVNEIHHDNADGSESTVTSFTEYKYDDRNLLVDASGFSTQDGRDIFGSGFSSSTVDTYEIIGSQARKLKSVTMSESEDIFGNISYSEALIEYKYNELGQLIDAEGYTDTTGMDIFGDVYSTHTVHEYTIINGQAKVISSYTGGNLVNPFSDLGGMLADLENKLQGFLEMTVPEKESFLQSIGLGGVKIADLTSGGISTMVSWLFKATTNVINCAVQAVYGILASLGIETTKEELAQTAFLVDILTGVITPDGAFGEAQLSMYSILKSAQAKGVTLKGANVNFEQLKSYGEAVIAHVGGDHYIVVIEISDTEVTYLEGSQEIAVTIEEFMNMWEGNILTLNLAAGATQLVE
ncbi:MAG: cysteine peptidase family C39 domain-containing protein, partial [Candidatus Gorgyraea atricola]|nr:cysteine peptidase family C39 domain-containing protein [Candidatus Gorgyraea atricola]